MTAQSFVKGDTHISPTRRSLQWRTGRGNGDKSHFGCAGNVTVSFGCAGMWLSPLAGRRQGRVEEHAERAERLAAPLGTESEQQDMARVELYVDGGRLAVQVFLAD